MSAIIQPDIPHIVFLDDFHNQDISSLLSEYTPLFKGGQKVDLKGKIDNAPNLEILKKDNFDSVDTFIKEWNEFIENIKDVHIENITNRISGDSLKLVFPDNFYLLGGANFNEKTLNIFADWNDRAVIEYIDPIDIMKEYKKNDDFTKCIKQLNHNLKNILEDKYIFDFEKYCFGIWKLKDSELSEDNLIKFFFSMIKNSLIYNNKNSEINIIGWELIVTMKDTKYFKDIDFNLDINENKNEIYKILHSFGIYED
jgi:hypothetical protein